MATIRKINVSELEGQSPNSNDATMPDGTLTMYKKYDESIDDDVWEIRIHDGIVNSGNPLIDFGNFKFKQNQLINQNDVDIVSDMEAKLIASNDIHIVTNHGNQEESRWVFDTVGGFNLPKGGVIQEGEMTGNTTIDLIPADPITSNQKLVVKGGFAPGDEPHLHLTTGNLTEISIFLGTDEHNVRTKENGEIEIASYNYSAEESKVWNFDTDGSITFPNATVQTTAWSGGDVKQAPSTSKGADGDKIGDIAFDSSYFYYCSNDWTDGQADIWKRVSWNQADTW